LADHACINIRLPTSGGLYAWELQKGRREMKIRVDGSLVFNSVPMIVRAAAAAFGLGFVMEDQAAGHIADGSLVTAIPRIPSLLSQPPAANGGVASGRGATLQGVNGPAEIRIHGCGIWVHSAEMR
jgi:hypothetical protein